uniref:Uncharacterized protein n=1 Tax=Rhizophora mucronata TaxID=61149 RepID=A0A2P2QIV3_RHIMU
MPENEWRRLWSCLQCAATNSLLILDLGQKSQSSNCFSLWPTRK